MELSQMARAAEQWLTYQRDDRRLADSSIATYRSAITAAFQPLPSEFSITDLHRALDARLGSKASSHVRYSSYVTLRAFFAWWEAHGGPVSPLAVTQRPTKPDARRRPLTSDELAIFQFRLMSADIKDRVECMLMLHNGFRISQVTGLRVKDIDFPGCQLFKTESKREPGQWVPMGPTMSDALAGYLDIYGIAGGWVFTGPKGRMGEQAIWKAWKRVCGPGLSYLTPHQARHTFANALLRGDVRADIHTVSRLMGHRNLKSTQLYLSDDLEAQKGAILLLDEKLSGAK